MGKTIFLTVSILALMLMLGFASAQTVWSFTNFKNPYSVYGSYTCNINGYKSCPSEMGWQGSAITFTFRQTSHISATNVNFNINTGYVINTKPIDVYVNGRRVAYDYKITSPGYYTITFPESYLIHGRLVNTNTIKVVMKNIRVGTGNPSAGFVFSGVSLSY